jgi:hypothetical protein
LPGATLRESGEAEIVKVDGPVTVSITVTFRWMPPTPVPVTVMGYVPGTVLDPTVIVMVELPAPGAGIGLGLKITVVPEGAPEADRAIALLKPPLMAVVMVEVPWVPCATLREAGEAEIVKLDALAHVAAGNTARALRKDPVTGNGEPTTSVKEPSEATRKTPMEAPGAG